MAKRGVVWISVAITSLLALSACGGREEPPEPDVEPVDVASNTDPVDVFAPPPVPTPAPEAPPETEAVETRPGLYRREPCGGSDTCVNLGAISVGHGEPGIEIYFDPERDDAIVQWSRTLGGVISCVEAGDELGTCITASNADEFCKSEFSRLAAIADDRAAFEAVFLLPGSPCRPAENGEVEP